jgi:hypothetical protein
MPEFIGRAEVLKADAFVGTVHVREDGTNTLEVFLLWVNLSNQSAFDRILQTAWIGMIRDSIGQGLRLRIFHGNASAFIETLEVRAPGL